MPGVSYAQEITVPLTSKIYSKGGHILSWAVPAETEVQHYQGLDTALYTSWRVSTQAFNNDQLMYEGFGTHFLTDKKNAGFFGDIRPDIRYIYKGKLKRNIVASFVGVDKKNHFHVCIDANNNADFGDDMWYTLAPDTLSDRPTRLFFTPAVTFDYYDGRAVKTGTFKMGFTLTVYPKGDIRQIDNYKTPVKFQSDLSALSYKEGQAVYKNKQYSFIVSDYYYNVYPDRPYKLWIYENNSGNNPRTNGYPSTSGELVKIGSGLFKISETVKDTLTLTYVKEAE